MLDLTDVIPLLLTFSALERGDSEPAGPLFRKQACGLDYGNTVYKTSVFNDKDGTITGVANSYIVNVTGIDVDEACEASLQASR